MADLSDIQAAGVTKIVGSDSSGVEQTPVQSTSNGALHSNLRNNAGTEVGTVLTPITVHKGIRTGGVHANVSVPTANTPVEVKVGGSRLSNRRTVTIVPDADMFWGYSNTVTTSSGTPIYKNQFMSFDVADDTVQIWIICGSASKNMRVTEAP